MQRHTICKNICFFWWFFQKVGVFSHSWWLFEVHFSRRCQKMRFSENIKFENNEWRVKNNCTGIISRVYLFLLKNGAFDTVVFFIKNSMECMLTYACRLIFLIFLLVNNKNILAGCSHQELVVYHDQYFYHVERFLPQGEVSMSKAKILENKRCHDLYR